MDQHVWTKKMELRKLVPKNKKDTVKENWALSGESASALRTGFKMGHFCLDAGHSIFTNWDVLLISHGHADHIFSIASFALAAPHVSRVDTCKDIDIIARAGDTIDIKIKINADQSNKNIAYVPDDITADGIKLMVEGMYMANHGRQTTPPFEIRIPSVISKECITIGVDKYLLEFFQLSHSRVSIGYGVHKVTKSLNPVIKALCEKYDPSMKVKIIKYIRCSECSDLPIEIRSDIDKSGVTADTFMMDVAHPQFCYLTDTSIKAIISNIDRIREYPIIIIECTFYRDDELADAIKKTHIHYSQLLPLLLENTDNLWILIHRSQKYKSSDEIKSILGTIPDNVIIW